MKKFYGTARTEKPNTKLDVEVFLKKIWTLRISARGNCVAIVTDAKVYGQFSKKKTQRSERPHDKQS